MTMERLVSGGKIEALLALKGEGKPAIGRDRILLLEAVETHGSITKAAQAVGLSYKAAWDAINAVNNLLPRPVIAAQTGGRHGGGAVLTEDGKALIASFHLLEERLAKAAELLSGAQTAVDPLAVMRSLGLRTSARNAFRCKVLEIRRGAVSAEIHLALTDDAKLVAIVTEESLKTLGVDVGSSVVALIKSSFVMLAVGADEPKVTARNRVQGVVSRREDGPVNSEITLDVGGSRTLTAIVTLDSANRLGLRLGAQAWALFKASHVVLAAD